MGREINNSKSSKLEFIKKVIKFGITGGLNTLVDFLIFNLLILSFLGDDQEQWIAIAMGYTTGMVCSYIINKRWTFRKSGKFFDSTLLRFILVNLISLSIKTILSTFLTGNVAAVLFVSSDNMVWFICTVVTIAINFLGSYFFAFKSDK